MSVERYALDWAKPHRCPGCDVPSLPHHDLVQVRTCPLTSGLQTAARELLGSAAKALEGDWQTGESGCCTPAEVPAGQTD
jgi:hypothetical protein